ncbi:hypothetical protein L1277_001293 [Okibacterium sp. HSC-33S16]|uniref:Dabb family protein n=1 Tax=Okibacterium sp. HSC-33S16 TaxID=2910965 RepID=UPI0020A06F61|nr:Dabb family protein [Okibacterium sp. HSC-33S16]MCP2031202.1 hypothetical protein [Okibacterium sp. HSC-33S16]
MSASHGVTHVVLVRWAPTTPPNVRESIRATARSLATEIPGISRLVEGPSVSPENLEQGFDYALVIDFVDSHARDNYLPHPAHLPLARELGQHSESVVVFDV